MEDAKRAKEINGFQKRNDNPKVIGVTFDDATIETLIKEGEDVEDIERAFVKYANSNKKRRKKMWDELRSKESI